MKINLRKKDSAGFAIIEVVLIIAVVAVIAGLAITYINNQKTSNSATTNNTVNTDNSTDKTADLKTPLEKITTTAPAGTTAGITELIMKSAESEAGIDSAADSQIQTNATSANGAATNIGGAFDASSL